MLSYGNTVPLALSALTIFSQASFSLAGLAKSHGHFVGYHRQVRDVEIPAKHLHAPQRRAPAGSVDIPLNQLQMLESEYTTYRTWMETWLKTAPNMDHAASIAQLKQEFQAYDGWVYAWINSTLHDGRPPPPPLPTSVPLPTSTKGAGNHFSEPVIAIPVRSGLDGSDPTHTPLITLDQTSLVQPPATSQPAEASSAPAVEPSPAPVVEPSSAPATEPSSAPAEPPTSPSASAPSEPAPSSDSGSESGGGSFDAAGSKNVAVYYGQTPATAAVPLSKLCSNPSVDIVILSFLTDYFGEGGYPKLNFGSACNGGPSTKMAAAGATGLLSCPDLAKDIAGCQSAGKKVLLSLGGAEATSAIPSDFKAKEFAKKLWDLFGDGTGVDKELRPFGDVKIDGWDIDNEDHSTANYVSFVSALRSLISTAQGRTYYISAAPQCPRPDASIPLEAMKDMDFVFVQFYNNGECDVGQPGFVESFKAWSSDLSSGGKGPKLYVGAPACTECAGRGYVEPGQIGSVIKSAMDSGVDNFGGVMLWDGAQAQQNSDYAGVVKKALG